MGNIHSKRKCETFLWYASAYHHIHPINNSASSKTGSNHHQICHLRSRKTNKQNQLRRIRDNVQDLRTCERDETGSRNPKMRRKSENAPRFATARLREDLKGNSIWIPQLAVRFEFCKWEDKRTGDSNGEKRKWIEREREREIGFLEGIYFLGGVEIGRKMEENWMWFEFVFECSVLLGERDKHALGKNDWVLPGTVTWTPGVINHRTIVALDLVQSSCLFFGLVEFGSMGPMKVIGGVFLI